MLQRTGGFRNGSSASNRAAVGHAASHPIASVPCLTTLPTTRFPNSADRDNVEAPAAPRLWRRRLALSSMFNPASLGAVTSGWSCAGACCKDMPREEEQQCSLGESLHLQARLSPQWR